LDKKYFHFPKTSIKKRQHQKAPASKSASIKKRQVKTWRYTNKACFSRLVDVYLWNRLSKPVPHVAEC
jgi:hypothetical protein